MAGSLVVVAIPDENDRVWKVSSEKVPHMTLLYLGEDAAEVPNVDQIILFAQHAAETMLRRFSLSVDRRGELGADKADVLFFQKRRYDFKAVQEFRAALLQDSNIKKAYDTTSQFEFPEEVGASGQPWIPHLTLGYAATPAKPEDDNSTGMFYDVSFNKLAVWMGDYEGPEFLLKDYWEDFDMGAVAMSDLQHFGVKGMRWGVRRRSSPEAEAYVRVGDTKQDFKDARVDAKWLKSGVRKKGMADDKDTRKIIDTQRKSMKGDIKALNKRPEYSGRAARKEFKRSNSELRQRYDKEQTELFIKHLKLAAEKHLDPSKKDVISPSGKWQKDLKVGREGSWIVGIKQTDKVRHAAEEDVFELVVRVRPIRDEDGYIVDYEFLEDGMAQTTELGLEFLTHHGVKGMKWGVRKDTHGRNRWEPEGHTLKEDLVKGLVVPIPGYGVPAQVRLARRAGRKLGPAFKRFGAQLADSNWENSTYSSSKHEVVHNTVAKDLDTHISKLQMSPKYAGKNLKADSNLRKTYYEDVAKVTDASYRRGVEAVYGTNYTGSKSAHYVNDVRGPRIEVRDKAGRTTSEAKLKSQLEINRERAQAAEQRKQALGHADISDAPDITIPLTLDSNGQISGVTFVLSEEEAAAESMTQTADLGAAFLEHYGVKGMKWGVRNQRSLPRAPQATSVRRGQKGYTGSFVPKAPTSKTRIKVVGGQNIPAHSDALNVAEAQAKLKKSGPAALSNQELRDVANRLQLERQVNQLTIGGGRKFIKNLLSTQAEQEVNARFKADRQRRLRSVPNEGAAS